jgi:hypothetical protein
LVKYQHLSATLKNKRRLRQSAEHRESHERL